jgi:hypothetical protein
LWQNLWRNFEVAKFRIESRTTGAKTKLQNRGKMVYLHLRLVGPLAELTEGQKRNQAKNCRVKSNMSILTRAKAKRAKTTGAMAKLSLLS